MPSSELAAYASGGIRWERPQLVYLTTPDCSRTVTVCFLKFALNPLGDPLLGPLA